MIWVLSDIREAEKWLDEHAGQNGWKHAFVSKGAMPSPSVCIWNGPGCSPMTGPRFCYIVEDETIAVLFKLKFG